MRAPRQRRLVIGSATVQGIPNREIAFRPLSRVDSVFSSLVFATPPCFDRVIFNGRQ